MTPKESSELHMKPLRCKIKIERSTEYGDSNKVVAYKPRQAGATQPPQAAGESGAPWPSNTVDPGPSAAYQETARQAEAVF
jgi:4'-phosphopantetheinyl transferase EntD